MEMVNIITFTNNKAFTVYKHTTPSGKVYIGITSTKPKQRWRCGDGYKNNGHFYRAIQKYGWENIAHEILFEGLTKAEACEKEVELIAKYQSNNSCYGYNKSIGGESGTFGMQHTEETKRKISESHKGIRPNDETRRKMSESHKGKSNGKKNYFYGKHFCGENNPNYGKHLSEETKRKIGATKIGGKNPQARKVRCIETDVVYAAAREAERKTGIASLAGLMV